MPSFLAVMAQATVEFTSPTTMTQSGRCSRHAGSKAIIMRAVCSACEPEPTSSLMAFLDPEVAEEVVRHVPAVVLAGVDQQQVGGRLPVSPRGERPVNGGDLHEVGAGTND